MRTLVHLSDLHFGRIDQTLISPLVNTVQNIAPDVVVVSGDLTQRARTRQFKQAREFLDMLPTPQIVVPGNHDIPLHNIFSRFMQPLTRYRRYITEELEPSYFDEEIAVVGINTARSLTIKDGRINEKQIARLRKRLCGLPEHVIKIVVTHHPFDLPGHYRKSDLVGRAPQAINMFAGCGVDLLLAGHMHTSEVINTATRYNNPDYSALVVQAGTATSTRMRGESNSFNVIRIDSSQVVVERYTWIPDNGVFMPAAVESVERVSNHWLVPAGS